MTTILKRPLITEKMTALAEKRQYAFEVDINANKIDIARAVEKKFNVTVESIRTIRSKGKRKAQMTKRGRIPGKRVDMKKAIVTLGKDQKIDFFENV
ncbi:MAG TPA: 50S ribosomal protein L23 [Bacteroidota bacterium]|nr:50S ribosomal protein L23 [Bacteroidota bacterium]